MICRLAALLFVWIGQITGQIAPVPDCADIPGINKDIVIPWTYTATGTLLGINWVGNAGSDFIILTYTGIYEYGPGYDATKVEHVQNGEAWLKVKNFQTSDAFEYKVVVTANDILSDQVTISHTDQSVLDDIQLSCDGTPLGPSDVIPEGCSVFAVAIPTTWVYNFIVSYDNGHVDGPVHKERADCPSNICSFNGEYQGNSIVFVNASLTLCSGHMGKTFIEQYGVAPGTPVITGVPTDPVIEGSPLSGVTCSLPSGEEGSPDSGYVYHWTHTESSFMINSTNGQLTIDPLNVTLHDGIWECRVRNAAGMGPPGSFSLIVHAAPVIWTNPPPAVSLIINETLSAACSFRGRPEAAITWTYNSNTLPPGIQSDSSTSPDGKYTVTTSTLSWSQATDTQRKAASGLYRCVANNTAGSETSAQMNLTSLYAPGQAAATDPSIDQVFEGTSVDLECSVPDPGSPRWHEFRWMKDGLYIDTTTTETYIIVSLTVADHDGIWTCTAVNTIGQGHPANISLTIYATPVLQPSLPPVVTPVAENSSLDILCSIQGRPPPTVMWDNNNLPLGVISVEEPDTTAGKLTKVNRRLRWADGSTLEQRRLTGKNYTCKGQILNEADEGTVKVDVQFGPYDTTISPPGDETVVENDTVTLTCGAKCNPGCAYTWSYEGGRKLRSTHVQKFQRGQIQTSGELHVDSIGRDNHGPFTCVANNNIGVTSQHTIYIYVHYPPDVFITRYPSGDLVQGMDVTVLCSVDSRPPDNMITWSNVTGGHPPYHDDSSNTTHSWITITDIDILDSGELRCTVDNGVFGSPRSRQIYVEVFGPARVHQTYPSNNRTGAGLGDYVSFQVSVIARPIPSSGEWSLMFVPKNFTAEFSVPAGVELIVNHDLATLIITNVTIEHFGNYSLYTSNSYGGWNTGDVVFQLFASGPPLRPTSFRAARVTAVSMTVEWMTGFDGGLPQTFTITYTNIDTGDEGEMSDIPDECPTEGCNMQRKITEGIADDAQYELQITADNGKGQAMGDTITISTPVRASLQQTAKISLGDIHAEITFSVIGQLTDVTVHHCVKDTEICEADKFPILNLQQNNQGRGRRQARDTMHNFSQTVDLIDPSASSFAFQFMLHDGDDMIHNTTSVVIERPGTNIGAIIGGVIGGLVLAALIVVLVLWRRGIIFQREKGDNKQISQEREYVNAVGPQSLSTIYNDIPADVKEPNTYEGLMEINISQETSTYAGLAQTTVKTFNTSNMNVLGVINDGAFYRVSVVSITSTHQGKLPNRLVMKATKDSLMYTVHSKYLEGAAEAMVKLVNCDNIMRCLGVDSSMTGLLLQQVPHGTLRQYLTGLCDNTYINSTSNQNRDLIHFIHQAANGAAAVAELRPETLFYCLSLDHVLLGKNLNVKLTGFSLAETVKAREVVEDKKKLSRPLRWLSPEAIDLQHTTQSDVWGFAVLIWEILSQGKIPFEGIADADIRSHIGAGHRLTKPPPCTDDMFDMMSECWKLKARSRPTMTSVKSLLHEMTVYQNV